MKKTYKVLIFTFLTIFSLLIILTIIITAKFYKDTRFVNKQEALIQVNKLGKIGSVKELTILPLIEHKSKDSRLKEETAVSYLIKADDSTILFDVGWNQKRENPSPLLRNMEVLGVKVKEIDYIFISHNHPDHTGGKGGDKSFALSREEVNLEEIVAYTPVAMKHNSAKIQVVDKPQIIKDGIISIGPLSRAIWLGGIVEEQFLAIKLAGKGIVLIVGCGHPSIEKIVKRAEDLFEEPIYAIIGGLHFPITNPTNLKTIGQKLLGPKLPWQGYQKTEVETAIDYLISRGVKKVGISPHDSCNWTIEQFRDSFGKDYLEIVVGQQIKL